MDRNTRVNLQPNDEEIILHNKYLFLEIITSLSMNLNQSRILRIKK